MADGAAELFAAHRTYLIGVAYRLIGSLSEAEDIVQEAFIRWQSAAPADVRSPKAWLTTVVSRLCVNHLKSARIKRILYFGPWLPEPLLTDSTDATQSESADSRLADSLSLAFLVIL